MGSPISILSDIDHTGHKNNDRGLDSGSVSRGGGGEHLPWVYCLQLYSEIQIHCKIGHLQLKTDVFHSYCITQTRYDMVDHPETFNMMYSKPAPHSTMITMHLREIWTIYDPNTTCAPAPPSKNMVFLFPLSTSGGSGACIMFIYI